jgi:YIF1
MSYYGGNANQTGSGGYYGQQQSSYSGSSQQYNATNQQYGQQQQQPPQQSQQQQYGYQNSYGDNSGWQQQQQPQQQSQTYGTSQYNQPQTPQPATASVAAPTFWNPSTAASMAVAATTMASGGTLSNDAMLDFANAAGKSFFQSGTAQMIPGLESSMLTLRSYFAVDNRYVIRKMKRFLLPILSDKQGWQRQVRYSNRFLASFNRFLSDS